MERMAHMLILFAILILSVLGLEEQTGIEVIDGSLGVVDDVGYYYVTTSIFFPDSFSKVPMYVLFLVALSL